MRKSDHGGGLYDQRFEHDACGLGTVVHLDGVASHSVVDQALTVLERLDHRGATGADPETGDGAGILIQMPHRFLARVASEEGIDLPAAGDYGIGMVFLPHDAGTRLRCSEIAVRIVAEEGHRAVGWREVPVVPEAIGPLARETAPLVRQLIIERRHGSLDAFERKLYVIRRRIQKTVNAAGISDAEFAITSMSAKTVV